MRSLPRRNWSRFLVAIGCGTASVLTAVGLPAAGAAPSAKFTATGGAQASATLDRSDCVSVLTQKDGSKEGYDIFEVALPSLTSAAPTLVVELGGPAPTSIYFHSEDSILQLGTTAHLWAEAFVHNPPPGLDFVPTAAKGSLDVTVPGKDAYVHTPKLAVHIAANWQRGTCASKAPAGSVFATGHFPPSRLHTS